MNIAHNCLYDAQQYYNNLSHQNDVDAYLVLINYDNKVQQNAKLIDHVKIYSSNMINIGKSWMHILLYMENGNSTYKDHLSEGETIGFVVSFGFIKTSFVNLLLSKSNDFIIVKRQHVNSTLTQYRIDDSFLFYDYTPTSVTIEHSLHDQMNANTRRINAIKAIEDNNWHTIIDYSDKEFLYLTTPEAVRDDFISHLVICLSLNRNDDTKPKYASNVKLYNKWRQFWLLNEKKLIDHRLINCLNYQKYYSNQCTLYSKLQLNELLNNTNSKMFINEIYCRHQKFIICPFEEALNSTGIKTKSILFDHGTACIPIQYTLSIAMNECYRKLHLYDYNYSRLNVEKYDTQRIQILLTETLVEVLKYMFYFESKTNNTIHCVNSSYQDIIKYSPPCILSLFNRLSNGTEETRLKMKERLRISIVAKELGLPLEILHNKIEKRIHIAYPNNYKFELKSIKTDLSAAYKNNWQGKIPNCKIWIEQKLCCKMKISKLNGTSPEDECLSILHKRMEHQTNYKPKFLSNPLFYYKTLYNLKFKNEYNRINESTI